MNNTGNTSNILEEAERNAAIISAIKTARRYDIFEQRILWDIMNEFGLSKPEAENYMQQLTDMEKETAAAKAVERIVKTARQYDISEEEFISDIKEEYKRRQQS